MRVAVKPSLDRASLARIKEIKAPTGGWNARDDWTDMDRRDAIVLDNLVVRESGIETRNGYSSWATGVGAAIKTLLSWNGPTSQKMFAAKSSAVYDVTSGGAVGAAVLSSMSNGAWSQVMFATTGGNYLVICNGANGVRNYDGTSWTTPAITGVTTANLVHVTSHMSRLWFVEEGTLKIWYLPALAIAGAATSIDFGGLAKKGGKLLVMASWSRDGGAGIDDHAVFITSQGEALVYSGSDPSSATTWQLVGVFSIPRPIGRRCIVNVGADIGILTVAGLLPMSGILPLAASGQAKVAATDKIGRAFAEAATPTSEAYGDWQVIESPSDNLLIVNVPLIDGVKQVQFVLHTKTEKWCRFTDINAGCWGLLNGLLYFGDNSGTVWKYAGDNDNGAAINWTLVQAFDDLGDPQIKVFKRIRPQLFSIAGYRPRVGIRTDYDDSAIAFSAPASVVVSGTPWGSAWGSPWGATRGNRAWWQSCRGEGYTVALEVMGATTVATGYNGAKIAYETGLGL